MCNSKAKGGKRCFAHSYGTRAITKMTQIITGASPEEVKVVQNDLRKEGKELPAPTTAQVKAFAEIQKRNVRFDPQISEKDKKVLDKQLTKASGEQPTGGGFHAWKNSTAETMRRFAKTPFAKVSAVVLVSSIALTGCSGDPTDPVDPPTSSSPSVTAPVTPGETESPTTEPTTEPTTPVENPIVGVSGVAPSGVDVSDGKGEYQQITVTPDSYLNTYDESIVDAGVTDNYSPEDIAGAQKAIAAFYVEEVTDSILSCNSTPENREAWIQENSDFFAPEYKENFNENIRVGKNDVGLVQTNTLEDGTVWRGDCAYDGGARKASYNAAFDRIGITEDGSLSFNITSEYTQLVSEPGGDANVKYTETTASTGTFAVAKDASGNWVLKGYQTSFNTSVDTDNPIS